MANRRTVFFISDRTGITAEMLGNSLLTQFESLQFHRVTLPFVDSMEKVADAVRQVRSALDRLPEAQRQLVDLAFFKGLTHTEIAEATGIPLGTVKTRLRTAMIALRGVLGS